MKVDTTGEGHGWVIPRPDGAHARCGGPSSCQVCQREAASLPQWKAGDRALGIEGDCFEYEVLAVSGSLVWVKQLTGGLAGRHDQVRADALRRKPAKRKVTVREYETRPGYRVWADHDPGSGRYTGRTHEFEVDDAG